jgi:hypothetical protein
MKLSVWRDSEYPKPQTNDSRILAAAASLVELLASRLHQTPPPWTKDVGALPEPIYLLKAAASMKRLRELCETEAPEPLRKRGERARPTFLNLPEEIVLCCAPTKSSARTNSFVKSVAAHSAKSGWPKISEPLRRRVRSSFPWALR